MTSFNKKIYEVGFVLYPLDDSTPLYFDNIYELLHYINLRIGDLVYKFNRTKDDYIYVKDMKNNVFEKLYIIED